MNAPRHIKVVTAKAIAGCRWRAPEHLLSSRHDVEPERGRHLMAERGAPTSSSEVNREGRKSRRRPFACMHQLRGVLGAGGYGCIYHTAVSVASYRTAVHANRAGGGALSIAHSHP